MTQDEWYRAQAGPMLAEAMSRTGNLPEAEEIRAEAARRVVRYWDRLDTGRGVGSWSRMVTRNTAAELRREWWARTRVSLSAPAVTLPDGKELLWSEVLADSEDGPEQQMERAERGTLIRRALGGLTPKVRAVVRLLYLEGLSYEAAARALRVPVGTVRSRSSWGRGKLARELAGAI